MAILMAFDTVFEQCSVAIVQDDTVLYHKTIAGNRGQTEIILEMVDEALTQAGLSLAQIDCLAFNRGPGAFSGIRINTAVVQALSVASDAPCVGVSSLAALADTACQNETFADNTVLSAVMDARQNQVYQGRFVIKHGALSIDADGKVIGDESLLDYDSLLIADVIVGDGASLVQHDHAKIVQAHPTAVDIARLGMMAYQQGQAVSAERALPVYLRDNAWKTLAEQDKA
ncbi:tRNA (adenosine(37)-N6)-threonylcarbamoyltransferase complex dimerization subunit type 1 TsaB [Moraxella pluranimalium]|uniref:tRNA threonylcarbamoyladenosine biosynthesis protein TsaB n=1 Tax=Moraxella pluranimalium TaxID=470453 RepID=A0A1T0CU77_9GAMM|nr:tRNA (adenosine(37)-N6)-threonylcarbamoyltransferase complex dimerization subunit type 1 TsaB [Moraxella pluranimalium]OOS25769.1 tRNA (adenosine(37)-N6)-threonylcarbamoyltransferase complex dimerization subunit type 1 TsaB [Moraxella pluranimalium]